MLQRYSPDPTPCRTDLSDNTNAWGMSPAARTALAAELSAKYPSPYADDLKRAISSYVGVAEDMITTGCGSDDVLDAAIRALARPGDRLAFPAPNFVMIPTFATINGVIPVPCPLNGLAQSGATVVYLSSPNNPTGALVAGERIEDLLRELPEGASLIVDEAYAEFAGVSIVDLVVRHPRLLVTRTMSKAFGLAGLRVGYAVGNPDVIAAVETSRGPYKVNALAERAAVAALTEGRDWMVEHSRIAVQTRERLAGELRVRGIDPLPSAANFLFVPMADAMLVAAGLLQRGVRVRAFTEPAGLRITVGQWPAMGELLDALDEVLACA
jgi:histidinol-phosphate aminotransferase